MTEQTEKKDEVDEHGDADHRKTVVVKVHNEDNGEAIDLEGHPNSRIDELIADMYSAFRLDRQPNDRLRCEGDGSDVFAHEHDHLNEYANRVCPKLVWLFVGDQGGASSDAAAG